jgi:hypothetical protein
MKPLFDKLFMRFAYGQIHLYGDIAMAILTLLPLHSDIATLIFESWSTYYFCLHKPKHIWQWVVNTQVVSLVWAGLGTEWIYDAFAGKSSFKCFILHTFSLNSMNSPTSCWRFSMYFQVLSNGTLLEVLAGYGMVIEDSGIHLGTVLNYFKGLIPHYF